jgi:hypothetical protein
MTKLKIIQGTRRELEHQLLAAMFMPGGNASAETLKQRLAPRGIGRIRAVSAAPSPSPSEPPPTPEPVDDRP